MTTLSGVDAAADGFVMIADALRMAVIDDYAARGASLSGVSGLRTLETNSSLAPRRGNSLLSLLAEHRPDLDLQGLRLADLGCGFGSLAVYLAYLGAEVTAVDSTAGRLGVGERVAREFGLPVRWVHGTLQDLPLPDRSCDLVLINNSLCYVVPRPERLVSLVHTRRILDPGGMILMRNPNRTTPRDPFTGLPVLNRLPPGLAQLCARAVGRHRSYVRLLSARAQRRELHRVGFEVLDICAARRRTVKPVDRWVASYQHVLARRPES
jgi:2-polyprenyl-3-methyl-5-hydroxy-6-metoxy-1,4-benzoquinol methylase